LLHFQSPYPLSGAILAGCPTAVKGYPFCQFHPLFFKEAVQFWKAPFLASKFGLFSSSTNTLTPIIPLSLKGEGEDFWKERLRLSLTLLRAK
jgi:hypothetical protein